jgi:UDPglucose 6-dehydrogenase
MMRIVVHGLWHLGSVTAACLASGGHDVVGLDDNRSTISGLALGEPPLFEPGLAELVRAGLAAKRLRFTADAASALPTAEIYWVAFDTPVDEADAADVDFVVERVKLALPRLPDGCLVIVSSQLPVGTVEAIARDARAIGQETLRFASIPENLRLGKAIDVFTKPDRFVVGAQTEADKETVRALLAPFTDEIVFMSVPSAEMTKHAINAFLATSVAFANEIATLCELVGADAHEVAKGLKSEARIGPRAYVSPGAAFAGGTLARDIAFLSDIGRGLRADLALIPAVLTSNNVHRGWTGRRLKRFLGKIAGKTVAVLGLTYKPGTSTLRRSASVELAHTLAAAGATVKAFDPAVSQSNADLRDILELCSSAESAVRGADAVVIATEWPDFYGLDWPRLVSTMAQRVVLDANGMLAEQLGALSDVTYSAVGRARPAIGR